jgi:DNA gyrase/topoisomerase IV subunit B
MPAKSETAEKLRARPEMLLGPKAGTTRIRNLVSEALLGVLTDALFAENAVIRICVGQAAVTLVHESSSTPLTSEDVTADLVDATMSQVGAQARLSGARQWKPPWTTWIGFPLVNAYSEKFQVMCASRTKQFVLRYALGVKESSEEHENDDGVAGLEITFTPTSEVEWDPEGTVRAVKKVLEALPGDAGRLVSCEALNVRGL